MNTITVAAIIVAGLTIVTIFFVRASRVQARKKKDAMHDLLMRSASQYGLLLTEHQIGKDAIGIDEINNKMIFIQHIEKDPAVHIIDLANVKEAMVMKRILKTGPKEEHIAKIELEVLFRSGALAPISLLFYEEIQDGVFEMKPLAEKAEYWKKKINAIVR